MPASIPENTGPIGDPSDGISDFITFAKREFLMNGHDGNVAFKCTYNDGGDTGFVGFGGTCSYKKHQTQREDETTALVLGLIKPLPAVLRQRISGKEPASSLLRERDHQALEIRARHVSNEGSGRETDSDEACAGGKDRTADHQASRPRYGKETDRVWRLQDRGCRLRQQRRNLGRGECRPCDPPFRKCCFHTPVLEVQAHGGRGTVRHGARVFSGICRIRR